MENFKQIESYIEQYHELSCTEHTTFKNYQLIDNLISFKPLSTSSLLDYFEENPRCPIHFRMNLKNIRM